MIACPSCGQENPDGFRLCGMCGAALAPEPTVAREERKVVTVVFCDLVGFTARAEQLDPEDVRAILGPYHERVRHELERHGGTVEKFIGDAVMALFGAPTAHEDDPERAVRAALAIRDFAADEGLELRVGVTTGEALVALGASPAEGEGMASGDVVNTAARLQSAAPVNGVLADETTYRATRRGIDFREGRAVEAKGKTAPIPVWEAVAARSRFGIDVAHEARSELVGRERELGVVRDAFERARHERTPQLLTLVGVPGIGKSRLVYELQGIVDADPELITWRQGRCLAYGDGITLWALGEIVKAQAGVLEQDTQDEIASKIEQSVVDVLAGTGDEARVKTHLLALLGLADDVQLGGDRRNESFAAWRRFLEALAEQRPLVLVVEDIHWADESLLDFLDELVDWVTDVPLLVVCTARPELHERRPNWGGGKLNATTLALAPLSDEHTTHLIGRLLGRPVLAADAQSALLERAGGNPLYAEQFAELYAESGSAELGLPETLQGIIAARLDGLPESEKGLLQDAAVVGKVFWASSIGRESDAAIFTLHSLERKGFVRRQRRSSLEGESEFAFAHALVRDVSYAQIPRADRARRHRAVAEWIDGLGRPEDHAEMLAYHWSSALELVRASGAVDDELTARTRLALRSAGDRAAGLNNHAAAASLYEDALGLWPEDDAAGPEIAFRRARALYLADAEDAEVALESARDALLAVGAVDLAAEAESYLSQIAWYRGHGETARVHLERAEELVGGSVSASAARVLAVSARTRAIAREADAALRIAQAAFDMATELGLAELRAHALTSRAIVHLLTHDDPVGNDELEQALQIALEVDSPIASVILNNMAVESSASGTLARTEELYRRGMGLAERYGERAQMRFIRGNLLFVDHERGRWDQALATAEVFIAESEAGAPHAQANVALFIRGLIRKGRGDLDGALGDHRRALDLARQRQDPQSLVMTLSATAATHAERDELGEARRVLDELVPILRLHPIAGPLSTLAPWAAELGTKEALLAICDLARDVFATEAARRALSGDLVGAADIFRDHGHLTLEAIQRFHAGKQLIESRERVEGEVQLRLALGFYRTVDATYYVERCESLLAQAATG